MLSAEQKKKKQRLVRSVIVFCCLLIPILGYLQRGLLRGDFNLPISSTILIFALININGLLLLLMFYLVLRNLVELAFERNQKILGSKLRTKMVISFVSLSLVPTALLFVIALRFVSTSIDYWFNANVEESLQSSLKLAQSILHDTGQQTEYAGRQLASILENSALDLNNIGVLEHFFSKTLMLDQPGALDSIQLLNGDRTPLVSIQGPRLVSISMPTIPSEAIRLVSVNMKPEVVTQRITLGELIQAIVPVQAQHATNPTRYLITTLLVPSAKLETMHSVSEGIARYKQLSMLKAPIKISLITMLLIATLLVLFGAIWFGFYIARGLTGPINKLAAATRRVAEGDLEFLLEKETDDEMGLLIDSFNSMTSEILASNQNLAAAHLALQTSNEISEQRRRYLETILKNVAAGVIALDENNQITTINRFAEQLLVIDPLIFLGKDFHKVLPKQHAQIVDSFIKELLSSGKSSIERHLRITIRRGETLSLQINITRMVDERHHAIGFVIVFDNLTRLEKAQRLAAWQEVARRIAHEIKNPLTPIQLSAQRLRKRFLDKISDDQAIFDQCTDTIINQVDEIKKLVSEFSDFARMPKIHKERQSLGHLVEEVVFLYQEAHKHLAITAVIAPQLPEFQFDAVQIKRVLINLLDNAVSMIGEGGIIKIMLGLNRHTRTIRLDVADNGPGIADEIKLRIFEPYFSTRKSGTGLGLAITHTIVTEHGGSIYARDNHPTGTVFTVELPLDS